jgi:hypothetical protein
VEQDDVAASRQAFGKWPEKLRALGEAFGPVIRQNLTPSWLIDDAMELEKTKEHGYCVGLAPEQVDDVIRRLQGESDSLPRKHAWSWVRMVLTDVALGLVPLAEGKERSDP